jgi:hypothetical protein
LAYNALLFAHYLVPVHTILLLLRPEAAHSNLNGRIDYGPRPGRGRMEFTLPRLKRMIRRAAKAARWEEIVDTP